MQRSSPVTWVTRSGPAGPVDVLAAARVGILGVGHAPVVAGAAAQDVRARPAGEHVVAALPGEAVVAFQAADRLAAFVPLISSAPVVPRTASAVPEIRVSPRSVTAMSLRARTRGTLDEPIQPIP